MRLDRPGVVDLRDLTSRYRWLPLHIPRFLELAGLVADGETRQSFAPPPVLIVIAAADEPWSVERAREWLADAARVVLIRDGTDIDVAAWSAALTGLDCEVIDGLSRDTCAAALASARRPLDESDVASEPGEVPPIELPPTPWSEYELEPRYGPPIVDRLERRGLRIDDEGTVTALTEIPPFVRLTSTVSAARSAEEARDAWRLRPGFSALGFDPVHPIGWRGSRMSAYWMYGSAARYGFLSASDHDFPCGPGKKLYGFKDNDPMQVVLAPDASVFAAHFEHDVLLTSAVPIPWRDAGSVCVAVFDPDPRRAVFFAQEDSDSPRMTDDLLDEDARDLAPALVLGPNEHYAIDLTHRVHRIDAPETVTQLGGPNAGFAVFDAEHRLVRSASGRLLGGWFRWATIEDGEQYWREDLLTGSRTRIAPVDLAIADAAESRAIARDATLEGRPDAAYAIQRRGPHTLIDRPERCLAIPGTRNVLLVGKRHFRMI